MTGKETILVTGASGFIGGWLAETLCLSRSDNVRAGIRSWSSAARLARFPVELVLCDVMDAEQIARVMAGVTCVIHCAIGSSDVMFQGTKNMLDAALAMGAGRFVHLSTCEVYGNVDGEVDETFPFQCVGNPYGEAKIEAEKLCWQYHKKGLPITVIRPSIVYGPFGSDWTVGLARRLQSGKWGIFESYAEGICNLIYVSDLVSGILLAARSQSAVGEAFNLVGPEALTWNQYFRKFDSALGLPELKIMSPGNARLRAVIMEPTRSLGKFVLSHFKGPLRKLSQEHRLARELMQYADKSIKTTPRPAELSLYSRNAHYLTTKARDLLGYKPKFGLDRGLELTVRWMQNLGYVDQLS